MANPQNPKDTNPPTPPETDGEKLEATPVAPSPTPDVDPDAPKVSNDNPHAYRDIAEGVEARVSTQDEKNRRLEMAQAEARLQN